MELRIQTAGTVPAKGYLYIPRPQDELLANIVASGNWFNVSGARTMGKSSLIVFAIERFKQRLPDLRVIYVDLGGDFESETPSFGTWLRVLATKLAIRMGIEPGVLTAAVGDDDLRGPAQRLISLMIDGILPRVDGQLLIVLDESDSVVKFSFKDDILASFRTLQAERAIDDRLQRLLLGFVGLRPIHEHAGASTGATSPIGEAIVMDDFHHDELTIRALSEALPQDLPARPLVEAVLSRTGGQPLLTMTLVQELLRHHAFDVVQANNVLDNFEFNLRNRSIPDPSLYQIERIILEHRLESFAALSTYLGILQGSPDSCNRDAPGSDVLITSGLIRIRDSQLEVKCQIFRNYFNQAWATRTLSRLATRDHTSTLPSFSTPTALKRVCVLITGGTAGMIYKDGKVQPPASADDLERHYQDVREIANVDFIPLFNLDSINIQPSHWTAIARAIFDRRHEGYSGFVVLHGTDSLAFTASAVAFALGSHLTFPVVFTGAQATPDVRHGDALVNLYRACLTATTTFQTKDAAFRPIRRTIPEVLICFGDVVLRAVRAQKKDERLFNGFESPVYPPLARISERLQIDVDRVRERPPNDVDIDLRATFASGILQIPLSPGLEPGMYEQAVEAQTEDGQRICNAVVLQTPGAGSVPTLGNMSFVPFIERISSRGVPVFLSTEFPSFVGSEGSSQRDSLGDFRFTLYQNAVAAGAIPVGNMTTPATLTKVRWAMALARTAADTNIHPAPVREHLKEIMSTSFVGEVDF